jgi:pteridine reductase
MIRVFAMKKNPLNEKVALITGAARRIGAEIARTLHREGMNVVLHYSTSEDAVKALSEELNKLRPGSASVIRADLQEMGSERSLVQRAEKVWHRLDVLVNNASRFYRTYMGKVTEYEWQDLMTSNLKAPFFLAQAAAPFLSLVKGCVVNITDIHAEYPLREYSTYCISKSGLHMATKVLAKELGPSVRVNAVAPGAVVWPEGENELPEDIKEKIVNTSVLKRAGSADDIAKAVLFFVRDADFITGQVLDVDGGRTL